MLARSEPSGISEPKVGLSPVTQSVGSQSVAHQSLLDVSQAILQHRDLNGLFRDLAVRLRAIVPFDFLNLVLFDAASNTMRLHILESTTEVEPIVPEMEFPPEDSPSGWVYAHQQPLVIADVNKETRWPRIMDVLKRNRIASS
jgi:formate hydrogenlyase transcriptional activator